MTTTRNLLTLFVLTALVLPLIGCGGEPLPPGMPKPVPCEVIVTQGGNPLAGALVRLLPLDGSDWFAVGMTDASGKATFFTMDRFKGAVPGKYKVIVNKTEDDPGEPLPPEYQRGQPVPPEVLRGLRPAASYYLVEEQYRSETTTLEIEVSKGTQSHTVDVGTAVRIKIEEQR